MKLILTLLQLMFGALGASACVAWGRGGCPDHPGKVDTKRFWESSTKEARGSFTWKDLGVLADSKLSMSQRLALTSGKGQWHLGLLAGSTASMSRKVITCLCSALVGLHLERSTLLGPWHEKSVDGLQQVQQKTTGGMGCSASLVRRGWGSWSCLAWGRDSAGGT